MIFWKSPQTMSQIAQSEFLESLRIDFFLITHIIISRKGILRICRNEFLDFVEVYGISRSGIPENSPNPSKRNSLNRLIWVFYNIAVEVSFIYRSVISQSFWTGRDSASLSELVFRILRNKIPSIFRKISRSGILWIYHSRIP